MAKHYTNAEEGRLAQGLTQLSLVEHALCPVDARAALQTGLSHRTTYRYTDVSGVRRTARVRVESPCGLSPSDEFYLWGLLALAFAQDEPAADFWATPHYCLRQLAVIEPSSKGGKSYRQFRAALERLAGVRYENDAFYDPIRQEHRRVSFGLLGYSLPLDERSSRAWRIVWDAQFFEFCQATGGRLRFDLALYRRLDPASRRLLLLLQKVFYRRKRSPRFGLRPLAVDTLGFSAALSTSKLKAKLSRASEALCVEGVLAGGAQFQQQGDQVTVEFHRGPRLSKVPQPLRQIESPLTEALRRIGLDERAARRVGKQYPRAQLQLWCDVTLAAIEEQGPSFFRRSPAAYFMDNLQAASRGERTPPDWFVALEKRQQRQRAQQARPAATSEPSKLARALNAAELSGPALVRAMTAQFVAAGQTRHVAKQNAERVALAARSARSRKRCS